MLSMRRRVLGLVVGLATISSGAAQAAGAWVPEAGSGYLQLGYSVKTADSSWSPRGDARDNRSWHIFRYVYTGGEVGLGKDLSLNFLALYLDGLEGPRGGMEHNAGFSEAFFGLTYQLTDGDWPMALSLRHRSSYLYDLPGPYDRHLHNDDGSFKGVSPEWRGLLGEDYGLFFLASKSLFDYQGWASFEVGYNYRTTNLSDEVPLYFELGYPLPWHDLKLKGSYRWVQSVGNDDDERLPSDRFGCSANNCFP
ncbi:MAG TPA: hypothetical protein VMR44_05025, partial [Thermoanaerobaculia bacterium]|nr:hypothetical protein [Thermoanaerobaculia bacterium]